MALQIVVIRLDPEPLQRRRIFKWRIIVPITAQQARYFISLPGGIAGAHLPYASVDRFAIHIYFGESRSKVRGQQNIGIDVDDPCIAAKRPESFINPPSLIEDCAVFTKLLR